MIFDRKQGGNPRPPRQAVLVVMHADGWVEAFAERNIDVYIVNKPHTGTTEGEVLGEEYLDRTLPRRYGQLHFPVNQRAARQLEVTTPSDIQHRDTQLGILRDIQQVRAGILEQREERLTWTV